MLSKFFIEHPIFATVISLMILVMGSVVIVQLPIEQFPDIVPPTVTVQCSYDGADAETVSDSVAIPIETQVNGVDNMIYMQSTCSNDGNYVLTVYFRAGTNPDMNTVNVMNRVNIATPRLPAEVRQSGVTVQKKSTGELGYYSFQLTEKARSIHDQTYLSNYVAINVREKISRVPGVGEATLIDARDYAMRIWLNPEVMAQRDLSVKDISNILNEQNIQIAAGGVGIEPAAPSQKFMAILTTKGRLQTVEDFENLVVRTDAKGKMLYLKDVAKIELDRRGYSVNSFNMLFPPSDRERRELTESGRGGEIVRESIFKPAATIKVYTVPGANTIEVARGVNRLMGQLKPELAAAGIEYIKAYDTSIFILDSIKEVAETLVLAVLIVIAVVYVFLQNWRAALIPSITIPVSLIGALLTLHLFGYSINTLTMLGLVLVIGIVVDDAIVVVENTQRLLDQGRLSPKEAAFQSMGEVTGPIIATTCVLMAVFLPAFFIAGVVGTLYRQFALSIIGAVVVSTLCALTLSPPLCAMLLRPANKGKRPFVGFRVFNFFFDGFARIYGRFLDRLTLRPGRTVLFWLLIVVAMVGGMQMMPKGFLPTEDQGYLLLDYRLPDGRSLQETDRMTARINEIVMRDFSAEVSIAHYVTGNSLLDSMNAPNVGMGLLWLKDYKDRRGLGQGASALAGRIMETLNRELADADVVVMTPPPLIGIGTSGGLEGHLVTNRENYAELKYAAEQLNKKGVASGEFELVRSTFSPTFPRLYLEVDREKAKMMGVSIDEIAASLNAYLGSYYVNDFNTNSRVFRVMVMAEGGYRRSPGDILSIPVMNSQNKKVYLSSVATLLERPGPQSITRFNLGVSAPFTGFPSSASSTGEAMSTLRQIAKRDLPPGYNIEWTGIAWQQEHSAGSISIVFLLSLVFGFLVLAAQYESWSAPLIIMTAVPLGVSGALFAVFLCGLDINLYTQIGLILMVGLSAKNAILITEFARKKWLGGETLTESARAAGRQRLRPIMMTSYAFILGVVPLMFSVGAGANSRFAIGIAVFGGMLEETMIGILVSPVLFIVVSAVASVFRKSRRTECDGRDALCG